MQAPRQTPRARFVRQTLLAGALLAALAALPVQAAKVGHARMVSASGQALLIELSLREVGAGQGDAVSVAAAPAAAWRDAGLTPPVALETLSFQLVPGPSPQTQTLRVRSSQPFHGDIADLLLDIRSGSGQVLHQVSVMAPDARSPSVVLADSSSQGGASSAGSTRQSAALPGGAQGDIRVKRGDTLFSIARSNAVPGVSVYQMMMALQAVNPEAFIEGNVNRLKAGASLRLPNAEQLASISDEQARRLFREQGAAFAAYRDRIAGMRGATVKADAAQGRVASGAAADSSAAAPSGGDQLVLSSNSANTDAKADEQLAHAKNIAESRERIAELEGNVQALNQAAGQSPSTGAAAATGQGNASQSGDASGSAQPQAADGRAAAESASGQENKGIAVPAAVDGSASAPADGQADKQTASQDAIQQKTWWQDNMLGIVTGLLALLVLLLVWWLRRSGVNRGTPITEEMVRQKLEQIDLDLEDNADEAARRDDGRSV